MIKPIEYHYDKKILKCPVCKNTLYFYDKNNNLVDIENTLKYYDTDKINSLKYCKCNSCNKKFRINRLAQFPSPLKESLEKDFFKKF